MLTTALAAPSASFCTSCTSFTTGTSSASDGSPRSNCITSKTGSPTPSASPSSASTGRRSSISSSQSCSDNEPTSFTCSTTSGCASSASGRRQKSTSLAAAAAAMASAGTYIYPKLQLVQIDNAWYALNQTCLQIYQQLQMCGTAQLMPVDVVPLNKLPDCIRKSLSSCSSPESFDDGKAADGCRVPDHQRINRRRHSQTNQSQEDDRAGYRRSESDDCIAGDVFRVYDVMSDSVNGSGGKLDEHLSIPANQQHPRQHNNHHHQQQQQANNANHQSVTNSDEKSWWSRLFPYCSSVNSSTTGNNANTHQQSTCQQHPPSSHLHHHQQQPNRTSQQRYAMRQVHRRQHQIVQKLMEETSLVASTGHSSAVHNVHHSVTSTTAQSTNDPSQDGPSMCVICRSTFATHRLLQRHRELVNHFGCSICSKSFRSFSTLQDHCDLLSHWSEGDSDEEDSVDVDSDDEYFFSSETSDDDN